MDFEEQFITGQEIEVGNDGEGFQGSWYAAKVVQTPLTKKKKLLVEYMTLMDDVQSSKPLQEYVDTYIVRPRPPQEEERFFELGELVEAFHNDGWWEGTITHVHDDLKCRVNLRGSIEELEFQQSELRSHHQWVGGRWVGAQERVQSGEAGRTEQIIDMDAAKDVAVEKSPGQVQSVETDQNIGMASWWGEDAAKNVAIEKSRGQVQSVETDQNIDMASQYGKDATKDVAVENSPGQAQQHAGNQSNPSKLGSPGRRQSLQAESIGQTVDMAVTPSGNPAKTVVSKKSLVSRNSRKVDNQTTPDKVSSASYTINCCKKRKTQSTSEGDTDSLNSSKNKKIQSTSASDINGIISSKKRMKVQSMPASDTMPSRTCEKLKTVEAVKTPMAPIACRARGMATRVLTEADDFTTQTTEGQGAKVKYKSSLENVEVKRVESLTLAEMFLNCSEEGYKDHPKDLISGQEQLKHVLESNGCRNQSSVEDSSHLPPNIIDAEQYEVVGLPKIQVPARPMKLRVRPLRPKGEPLARDDIKQQTSNVSIRKTRAKVSITKDLVKESLDVEHNGTIGRLQAPITSREAQSKGPQQTTPSKEISKVVQIQREDATKETNMDWESSNIGDLHQLSSSSMCLWNSVVAQIVDENGVSSDNQPTAPSLKAITGKDSPANTLLDQAIGDEVSEHIQQSFLISSSTNQLLLEDETFPFIKCSPVWKAVESLEVFHTMPQKLHFHPLEQLDMNLREGHAIGSMVNFANIVEQVGKMKHDDPLSILQESSKALENFKAHGFNVQPIQARLGTLLRIKEEQAKLNGELMEAEDQINMEVGLKISIIAELDEHNQKTRELQECLNQVIKKRELAVLKKEVQDAKIAELEKTMVIVRECIRSVTSEFRNVVATPWINFWQSIEDPELVVASSGGAEGNERVTMAAELSPSPSTQLPAAAAGTPTSTADVALLLHHFECSLYS